MKKRLMTILPVLLVFAAGFAVAYAATTPVFEDLFGTTKMRAQWEKHFDSVGALVNGAEAVVVGEVVGMTPGRTVPEDPTVTFTNVRLKVNRAIKGDVGAFVDVEVVGNHIESRLILLELPEFEVGGRYLLFLAEQKQAPFLHYVINNQGGFTIRPDAQGIGVLKAADHHDEVAEQLHDMRLPVALGKIAREAAAAAGPRTQ